MSRKLLIGLLVLGVMLAVLLSAGVLSCGKSTSPGDITVTSSVSAGHSHQITISGADINNPSTQKTISTTYVNFHTHTITLTQQDYQTIKNGGTVTVTTSEVNGHTHTFTIKK
jgi:hypothetical protein